MKPQTIQQAIDQARQLAAFARQKGDPVAFEVVKTKNGFEVQPFGMHTLFKSHKLIHVEPIPGGAA